MSVQIPSPQSKQFSALNRGNLFGNLVETRNLDFNRRGFLGLAGKPYVWFSETQDANFETPICFASDDDFIYVVTNEDVYSFDPSSPDFTATSLNGGSPPDGAFSADNVFFNGEYHVSDSNSVHSLTGTSWTADITGLSSSYPHPLCVSEHQQFIAVGNGPAVALYNTAYALQTTLVIPTGHIVTWIRWRANMLWCGTRNIIGGEAKVYVWNGSGTAAQAGYGVGGDWAYSGCTYPGTIVVVSSTGQLLRFGGDGFVPLRNDAGEEMAFPCYWENKPWGSSASTLNLLGKIASRGMEAKGRLIYMNVDSTINLGSGTGESKYIPNFPGGLWVFDPSVGLYHKAGVDHKQRQSVAISSYSGSTVTLASAAVFETGDPIALVSNVTMTGVKNLVYYAIKVSTTQLKFAYTAQEAKDGVGITLGGTADGDVLFNVYQSIGAVRTERAGGLMVIRSLATARYVASDVVYGGEALTTAGSIIGVVMSLGMGRNEGFGITPRIYAENLTDIFKKLFLKFEDIDLDTWGIIVKYRTERRPGLPGRQGFDSGGATFVNSTSFTINPTTYDVYALQVGDEVQFLNKAGAGYCRNITTIVEDSATQWTITFDEALPDIVASDTSHVLFDNWTKYKTITRTDDLQASENGIKEMLLAKRVKWVQLKIVVRGYRDFYTEPNIEELMVLTGADQKYA